MEQGYKKSLDDFTQVVVVMFKVGINKEEVSI